VYRREYPLWIWSTAAGLCLVFCFTLSAAFTVYWTHKVVSNECAALTYIINDAHLNNPQFKAALIAWARGDECRS
jgi:hypothetical protein